MKLLQRQLVVGAIHTVLPMIEVVPDGEGSSKKRRVKKAAWGGYEKIHSRFKSQQSKDQTMGSESDAKQKSVVKRKRLGFDIPSKFHRSSPSSSLVPILIESWLA